MRDRVVLEISGFEDLGKKLEMAPRRMLGWSRQAVHAVAGEVRNLSRKRAPKGATGMLRKNIKTRRRKVRRGIARTDVTVIAGTSRKAKDGAWYWHFVERGTRTGTHKPPGQRFIEKSYQEVNRRAPKIYEDKAVTLLLRFMSKKKAA